MIQYKKYNIKDTDSFEASDFPKVQGELEDIIKVSQGSSSEMKGENILTYLKERSIKSEWVEGNHELTALLTGKGFTTSHIEGLFESCQQNKSFLKSYEDYIKQELAPVTT